tara:strand:+ start:14490 stop:15116 length:627 start_codon:yes stop_codon:yes gene_type:complete
MTIKFGFTSLTRHALCRLGQRTGIDGDSLRKLLDKGGYIKLGLESAFDRQHCLFYSQPDNECFVAVQDIKTGEVITVLPLNYHKTLSWKMDKKLYNEIDEEFLRRAEILARYNVDPDSMAFQMSLKIRYLNSNDTLRTKTLKKFPAEQYQNNSNSFISNKQEIFNIVTCWLKEKEANKVIDLYVSLGRKSSPNFVCDEFVDEINGLIG